MTIANSPAPYVNGDTLIWKYPKAEQVLGTGGEWRTSGNIRISEFKFDYTQLALGTSDTVVYILDYNTVLPAGAVVEYVDWVTHTAFAGASGTYNVGLVKRSDATSIVDADGLVAALTVATVDTVSNYRIILADSNVGTVTFGGALLDDTAGLAFDSLVCMNWNTTVPSAGAGSLRIGWRNTTLA